MKTDSSTLVEYALELYIRLTTPTTRIVLVGPHILFIDSSSGQVLDLRKTKVFNNLLRQRNLLALDRQVNEALHYAFVGILEGEGEYLEVNLQQRGMLSDYRMLVETMPSKRKTGKLILQIVGQHGIYVLLPEDDYEVKIKDWVHDLPIELENQWSSFEPFEPRVI